MFQHYKDISRIAEPPKWFDDAGVPRFDAFAPGDIANIYAEEAAHAEVSCQSCETWFRVALTNSFAEDGLSLGDAIRLARVHYGDPPYIGCCPAGPTMSSEMHDITSSGRATSRSHSNGAVIHSSKDQSARRAATRPASYQP